MNFDFTRENKLAIVYAVTKKQKKPIYKTKHLKSPTKPYQGGASDTDSAIKMDDKMMTERIKKLYYFY
ncbi:hypothetical protein KUTeg_000598 [Tegillarca granosa]|uniref:Uncharacterized protein n=1 Tax=Tegillarca granosa TaxID=220873 RepID=A0ABQ9FZ19_TEGGR|nr:hypothetical protein KUTeg_000598 [Tegillarca granosa]